MAKQIAGVYERVLACAKKEFLEKGFMDASLRVIAAEAGTSTGSIYTRFGDKEGLFREIVDPAAQGMLRMFLKVQQDFHELDGEVQKEQMGVYTSQRQEELIDYMYDNFDAFKLLLDASYGTKFQSFLDRLVDVEVEYTYRYMEVIGCESLQSGEVTEEFIHMVVTAYFNGMFEVIRHGMPREDGKRYIRMLARYHMAGFDTVFEPEKYR